MTDDLVRRLREVADCIALWNRDERYFTPEAVARALEMARKAFLTWPGTDMGQWRDIQAAFLAALAAPN